MIIKKNLSKRKKIINLIKEGTKFENNFFKIYILHNEYLKMPELYVTNIAKKSIKKSYLRNLNKRRIKAIFNKIKKEFIGKEVLIMPKYNINLLDTYEKIEKNLMDLLNYCKTK